MVVTLSLLERVVTVGEGCHSWRGLSQLVLEMVGGGLEVRVAKYVL